MDKERDLKWACYNKGPNRKEVGKWYKQTLYGYSFYFSSSYNFSVSF